MPRDRMQHIAALPSGKSCSVYAANLIVSTLKNNCLLTIFQVTKTVEHKTCVFRVFSLYLYTTILKPLTYHMPRQKLRLHYS